MNRIVLEILTGPLQQTRYAISNPMTCIIGRESDCTIVLPEEESKASRYHCLIDIKEEDWSTIEDLESTNGTFLNGENIQQRDCPVPLTDQDIFVIGDTQIRFIIENFQKEKKVTISNEETLVVCERCGKGEKIRGTPTNLTYVCESCRKATIRIVFENHNNVPTTTSPLKMFTQYQIEKELGNGSAGTVYLATESTTGEKRAIKVLFPHLAANKEIREMFLKECRVAACLNHSNIVKLYDSGQINGFFYLVMEYCNNGTIQELVKKRGPLPIAESAAITLQILDGLNYAHNLIDETINPPIRQGLIHRDIKPENILLHEQNGTVLAKIADFGLAKVSSFGNRFSLTQTGAISGTPGFMCRQQVINYKHVMEEVDIWSAVATFFFLLTGCAPRNEKECPNPLRLILEQETQPIQKFLPSFPTALAQLINQALDDREKLVFSSTTEFKTKLIDVLDQCHIIPEIKKL